MREDEKAKAKEILKKRDRARKGLAERPDGEGADPVAEQEERETKIAWNAAPIAAMVKRSG